MPLTRLSTKHSPFSLALLLVSCSLSVDTALIFYRAARWFQAAQGLKLVARLSGCIIPAETDQRNLVLVEAHETSNMHATSRDSLSLLVRIPRKQASLKVNPVERRFFNLGVIPTLTIGSMDPHSATTRKTSLSLSVQDPNKTLN